MAQKNTASVQSDADDSGKSKLACGIVRPISSIGDYAADHWSDVADIIDEAVLEAGLEPRLVSDANSTGIIHARIVRNLYSNPVVVCDISAKNPNVMLELGMRLAFDKPVIVIKDDETEYSFDTSPIEHLGYPRSLHYASMIKFKADLILKIKSALNPESEDKSFLQQFGPIKLPEIDQERVPAYEILKDDLNELKALVLAQSREYSGSRNSISNRSSPLPSISNNVLVSLGDVSDDDLSKIKVEAEKESAIDKVSVMKLGEKRYIRVKPDSTGGWTSADARQALIDILQKYRRGSGKAD